MRYGDVVSRADRAVSGYERAADRAFAGVERALTLFQQVCTVLAWILVGASLPAGAAAIHRIVRDGACVEGCAGVDVWIAVAVAAVVLWFAGVWLHHEVADGPFVLRAFVLALLLWGAAALAGAAAAPGGVRAALPYAAGGGAAVLLGAVLLPLDVRWRRRARRTAAVRRAAVRAPGTVVAVDGPLYSTGSGNGAMAGVYRVLVDVHPAGAPTFRLEQRVESYGSPFVGQPCDVAYDPARVHEPGGADVVLGRPAPGEGPLTLVS